MGTPAVDEKVQIDGLGRNSTSTSEPDGEKPNTDSPDFGPAPDGGLTAWLVAAGGATVFFCCLGFTNAFGAFEEYYLTHQLSVCRRHGGWADVRSLWGQGEWFPKTESHFVADTYQVIRPAALAYVFAVMMLSLCKTYWQVMLVQGVLMGVVMGFLQIPVFASISHWFDRKRAAAFGIVVSGSSIGGVVIPIAISKMLNGTSLGYGWTVRIIGFLVMPLLAFSCITVKARLPPRVTRIWIPEIFKDNKYLLLVGAMFFMFMGMFTPLFYIPTYATMRGLDSTLAGYLLAILNAASTFGRIIPGVLADKIGRINVFAFGGIATGMIIFCMNSAETSAGLIAYAVIFGFWSGTIISGASAAITLCVKDPREVGTYLGMGIFIAAFGTLIGPPINGALVDKYMGFFQVSMFSGALTVFGGLLAIAAKAVTAEGLMGRT
ncbi:putative Major facilitator superfamily (MFS) profile domain-containing protein [Seiridium cardinale]